MGSTALDKNHQGSQSSLSNGDFKIQESSSTVTLVKNDHRNLKKIKFRGWKNALALSFGWLFLYTGYLPMSSIQSSLNGDNGLGTVSLSVQSAMEMIGNLFLSNLIINKIGCKWTVAIGSFLFSSFIAANFYPMWGTMVPTAALAGLGVSLTWIAHNTYMTKLSQYYAEHTGIDFNTINIRFFGTFYSIYYSSNVVGNVASSFLLGADFEPDNETFSYDPMALCGSDYCNEDLGTYFHPDEEHGDHPMNFTQANSQRPEMQEVYSLCGFCLGSTILATLLFILCVDSLPSLGLPENMDDSKSPFQIFVATFQHLNNPNQLLLLPLTFYNGLDNDFIYTEFTKVRKRTTGHQICNIQH